MNQLEPWAVLVGAALGGAGLSGALTSMVQLSRASRVARSIQNIKTSLEGAEDGGVGELALRIALDRERLRLASLSIIGMPQRYVQLLFLLAMTAVITVGVFATGLVPLALPWGTDRDGDGVAGELGLASSTATWLIAGLFGAYILFFVVAMDHAIQRRRAQFITAAYESGADLHALASAGEPARQRPHAPSTRGRS